MLFNSYPFLFGFLPIALIGYQIAARWHRHAVVIWLSLVSLAFYAYWRPEYLVLLCASVLFNYLCGSLISRRIPNHVPTATLLLIAIFVNVAALCYYKYLFPMLNFLSGVTGSTHRWTDVILPLGISFFTFTQIAYLVDLQQGVVKQQDLGSYTLFATFFPHLIAGPILHHAEIMPQFQQKKDYRLRADDFAVGTSWFIMGLFKKVLLADRFAPTADAAFAVPGSLTAPGAWAGVLAFALQLYFDFSGYSDMALGLARMFSIDFPLNFSSPYKAASIIDYWQRWHSTLTRYITAYLYNPVSLWITRRRVTQGKKVSRKAMATGSGFASMIAAPTIFSLFLAGIWHGAGLQFLVFGLLHGMYLTINQAWRIFRGTASTAANPSALRGYVNHIAGVLLTFAAVLVGHVFFRSASVSAAISMLAGMAGLHHASALSSTDPYRPSGAVWLGLAAGYCIVWFLPNTQQILLRFKPALELPRSDKDVGPLHLFWRPTVAWGIGLGLVAFYTLIRMQNPSSFLYFQF